jgi:hypothetical protein
LHFFHLKPFTPASSIMINSSKYAIQKDLCKKSFEGTYNRSGAKLVHSTQADIRFVIGTRAKTTRTKTPHFLLYMEGRDKPALYFSSMYGQQDPNTYELEYEKVRYRLVLDSEKAEITVLSNQSQQAA